MVLKVQRSCISLCRQDSELSLDKVHKIAEQNLRQGLQELGFDVSRNVSYLIRDSSMRANGCITRP
jgi:intermediate cleaving peptidase 55